MTHKTRTRRIIRAATIDIYTWGHGAWHYAYSKPRNPTLPVGQVA